MALLLSNCAKVKNLQEHNCTLTVAMHIGFVTESLAGESELNEQGEALSFLDFVLKKELVLF